MAGLREGLNARRLGVAARLIAGGLVSGGGAYVFHLLAARGLTSAELAPLAVVWTLQYLVTSIVLFPIEVSVAFAVASGADVRAAVRSAASWIAGSAAVLAIGSFALRHALFPQRPGLAGIAAVSTITYGAYAVRRGRLTAARETWRYATMTALDGAGRAGVALLAAGLWPSALGFALGMPLACLPALAVATRRNRPAPEGEAPAATAVLPSSVVGNALAQTLLVAAPVACMLLGASSVDVGAVFLVTSLSRIPLVLAFNGLLPSLIPFADRLHRADDHARLRRNAVALALGTAAAAATAAGIAAWVGPALIGAMFGHQYGHQPVLLAGATAGAVVATGSFGSAYLLIGRNRAHVQPWPWAAGLVAATAIVVTLPHTPLTRVAVALPIGETVALALFTLLHLHRPAGASAHSETASERR